MASLKTTSSFVGESLAKVENHWVVGESPANHHNCWDFQAMARLNYERMLPLKGMKGTDYYWQLTQVAGPQMVQVTVESGYFSEIVSQAGTPNSSP